MGEPEDTCALLWLATRVFSVCKPRKQRLLFLQAILVINCFLTCSFWVPGILCSELSNWGSLLEAHFADCQIHVNKRKHPKNAWFPYHWAMFSFLKIVILLFNLHLCVYACMFVCILFVYRCLWRPEKNIRFPGTGVTGNWEPLIRVLGTEPESSLRATSVPNYWAISLVLSSGNSNIQFLETAMLWLHHFTFPLVYLTYFCLYILFSDFPTLTWRSAPRGWGFTCEYLEARTWQPGQYGFVKWTSWLRASDPSFASPCTFKPSLIPTAFLGPYREQHLAMVPLLRFAVLLSRAWTHLCLITNFLNTESL